MRATICPKQITFDVFNWVLFARPTFYSSYRTCLILLTACMIENKSNEQNLDTLVQFYFSSCNFVTLYENDKYIIKKSIFMFKVDVGCKLWWRCSWLIKRNIVSDYNNYILVWKFWQKLQLTIMNDSVFGFLTGNCVIAFISSHDPVFFCFWQFTCIKN